MAVNKITNADLQGKGVIGLDDTPGLSTEAMQAKFEETARSVIIPKVNEVIDDYMPKSGGNFSGTIYAGSRSATGTMGVYARNDKGYIGVTARGDSTTELQLRAYSADGSQNKNVIQVDPDNNFAVYYAGGTFSGETTFNGNISAPNLIGKKHIIASNNDVEVTFSSGIGFIFCGYGTDATSYFIATTFASAYAKILGTESSYVQITNIGSRKFRIKNTLAYDIAVYTMGEV